MSHTEIKMVQKILLKSPHVSILNHMAYSIFSLTKTALQ